MSAAEPRFGTDGVRGVAGTELTPDLALRLGAAAALVLSRHVPQRLVIVGRDTRVSGEMLEAALSAGLASLGCNVCSVGVLPTPGISRLAVKAGAAAGAVVSASHNPFGDNGIKFFASDGRKLDDDVESEIESWLDGDSFPLVSGEAIGRISSEPDRAALYVAMVQNTAPQPLNGMRIVLDCANGATHAIAPDLFADLGADVTAIHTSPDGVNINAGCGSTRPQSLCEAVQEVGADAGLAFDGDGDRVMMCDERGSIVDGDRMMYIIASAFQNADALTGNRVVATIMSNAGLDIALERRGIALDRTDVGDRYVAQEMDRSGAALGGEQSGHLLLPALTPTGDGMVTGLQVLGQMVATGKRLSDLASEVTPVPQLLRSVRVHDRTAWQSDVGLADAIEDARRSVGKPEWLSVRSSGTEPLVRVMAQDVDSARVEHVVTHLCEMLRARYGA